MFPICQGQAEVDLRQKKIIFYKEKIESSFACRLGRDDVRIAPTLIDR